jgi:hypothetical protein
MRYDGQVNSPGAPGNNAGVYGNAVAGTWIRDPFRQGQQPEADQLFRRGMDNTPAGQRVKELRDVLKSNPGSLFAPQAMGLPGMVPMGNVGFYAGPQVGQMQQSMPPGFINKTVS